MIENLVKYVALISLAGAGVSFMVGLWKYLDQRKREDRTERFKVYHRLMQTISAMDSAGNACPLTQQLAAIYELQHFPEYAFASEPILKTFTSFLCGQICAGSFTRGLGCHARRVPAEIISYCFSVPSCTVRHARRGPTIEQNPLCN
jgi:hypothetical protein